MTLPANLLGAASLLAGLAGIAGASSGARLEQVLARGSLTVEFDRAPAREAFAHVQRLLGVAIVGRYSDDRAGGGIDPETPVTLRAVRAAPIEVIEEILAQCADREPCTWQVRNGYLEVGTRDRLSAPQAIEVRVYEVRDLLFEPAWFDNAPGIDIAEALGQTGGGVPGGGGSGGGGRGSRGGRSGGGGPGGGSIIGEPGPPRSARTPGNGLAASWRRSWARSSRRRGRRPAGPRPSRHSARRS